jgi:chromate transporter
VPPKGEKIKPSKTQLFFYYLKLGVTGFGGPVALVSAIQRDLVDRKKWFPQEEFNKGLVLSQMAPGPMATQLSMYLGWYHSGYLTAALVGFFFILPSFFICVALAVFYIKYENLAWIRGVMLGISPVIVALIVIGSYRLARKNLKKDIPLWIVALANLAWTVGSGGTDIRLFISTGLVYALLKTPKKTWLFRSQVSVASGAIFFFVSEIACAVANLSASISNSAGARLIPSFAPSRLTNAASTIAVLAATNSQSITQKILEPGSNDQLFDIFIYFLKAGSMVFGSGLVIVPFLHGGVVLEHRWLTERQFLDAVAVAMITPGPVVITVAFIGYLIAGFKGATLAALGIFLPCYFFAVLPAPHYTKIMRSVFVQRRGPSEPCSLLPSRFLSRHSPTHSVLSQPVWPVVCLYGLKKYQNPSLF